MSEKLFRKEVDSIKPYIPGKSIDELKKELGIENIEKLAYNENPLGPSLKAIHEIKKELDSIHIYPDPNCTKLKDGLCKKFNLKHENIVVGNGGEELLKIIAQTFINEGDEAIMANPTFEKYASEVLFMGGVAHQIELKEYKHDFEKFIQKINDKTKLIYVCNPNNPTGNIMTKDDVDYLVKNIPEDVVLVFDEAYYEYAIKNDKYPDSLEILRKRPNTIILRTFSKAAGIASVRVGYLLTSSEITNSMNKMKMVFNVNRLAQAAGIGALDDDKHIDKTVELNYECMRMMEKYFEENNIAYIKSNSNFIFVNVGVDSKLVFEKLLKKGIIVRPGYFWDWKNWLRVSTGTKEQTQSFIDALQEAIEENKIHA